MTNYTVVPSTTPQTLPTIASSSGSTNRFSQFENLASTFTMQAGSFLTATGAGNNAVGLHGSALWTVNINGTLTGANSALSFGVGAALAKVNVASLAVLTGGTFSGLYAERPMTLTNKGLIESTAATAINLGGLNAINTITNSGEITGSIASIDSGGNAFDTVTNTKTGSINGVIELRGGNDTLTNAGVIRDDIRLGDGHNTLSNTNTIGNSEGGNVAVRGGADNDVFSNSKKGFIFGDIFLGGGGEGGNSFKNQGFVRQVNGGSAIDKVSNSGTISGDVSLFGGNDILINTGKIIGFVEMGFGDDTYKGGKFVDRVFDSTGSDQYSLGSGDDLYIGFFGGAEATIDTVDGGKGFDIYFGQGADSGLRVNLDNVSYEGKTGILTAATAQDANGGDIDKIKGFEGVAGSNLNDEIFGRNKAADKIDGGGGVDYLWGLGGNDEIYGGGGGGEGSQDHLIGGMGADRLEGKNGSNDHFVYFDAKESGPKANTRDTVFEFEDNQDMIEFNGQLIGKFTTLLATDAAFTGAAGQLHVLTTAKGWLIEGDINGDKKADISIAVDDADHSIGWEFVPNFVDHGDILR
jgi:hypothetical protein